MVSLGVAIVLALLSAVAVNVGYLLEQQAAAKLPALTFRHPLHSVGLLLRDKRWRRGFGTETAGFLCFVAAVGLAPLSVVQSISAGGVAVLAFLVARATGKPLGGRQVAGVVCAVAGLVCLGISLAGAHGEGDARDIATAIWLGGSAVLAGVAIVIGRHKHAAAAYGVAAGILFAAGDVSTKLVVSGGLHTVFLPTLIAGYAFGTACLQLGFQRGSALTAAGICTLLTNALPIVAATAVLGESLPTGPLRAVRIIAFVAVVVGGVLLAHTPDTSAAEAAPAPSPAQ